MEKIKCPECGGKGLEIIWGYPTPELMERAERDGDVLLGGCCIGLGLTHGCASCGHRWDLKGWVGTEDEEDLWIVGERDGDLVLADTDEPEDDTEVWLEYEPENRVTLAAFDDAQGEGVVGWLAEPEPYDPNVEGAGSSRPVAFGAIGDMVLIAYEDRLATWTRAEGIKGLTVTPDQYMKFNGGYVVNPTPGVAAEAVRAYKANPPSFEDTGVSANMTDPDVLNMNGPNKSTGAEPNPFAGCFVVGEIDGQRILSDEEMPNPDDSVWLEYLPSVATTLEFFDELHEADTVIWCGEPQPYVPSIPWLVSVSVAAAILDCSITELTDWRRTVLPSAPRRFYAQTDDEFRHQEVVAIAVGRWLRRATKRPSRASDYFASHLASSPPQGEDWVVVRRGPRKIEVVHGTASFDMTDGRRIPPVFHPDPIIEALRNH